MLKRGVGAALLHGTIRRGHRLQPTQNGLRGYSATSGNGTKRYALAASVVAGAAISGYVTICNADAPKEPPHVVERIPHRTAAPALQKAGEPNLPYVSSTEFYVANNPREDRSCAQVAHPHGKPVYIVGMLDGHGGHQCAEYARTRLGDYVVEYLQHARGAPEADGEGVCDGSVGEAKGPRVMVIGNMAQKENQEYPGTLTKREIEHALINAFERTDRSFLAAISSAFHAGFTRLARVGACSLYCVFHDKMVYTANAGDCLAVMGRAGHSDVEAVVLNNEHNARVAVEAERLGREHPNEANVIKCKPDNEHACYVKGRLQPTRSLGDAELKYQEFNATPIRPPYTPPYITATPEVIATKITSKDKFIIIATDGLWDHLSPAEAVKIACDVLYCPTSKSNSDQEATVRQACRSLIDHALQKTAEHAGMEIMELKALPLGRERRRKHDDITVTIVKLD